MKKRLLSLVLCLVMVFSLMPFAASAEGTSAEAGNPIFNPAEASDETGNLKLTKELSMNDSDGTYDITLKSWATATVETEIIPEQVPTDFVLVLDQSGSMATVDMPTGFTKVNQTNFTTQNIVDAENNNDSYYYLAPNGKYYAVHERDAGTYSQLSDIHIYQQDGIFGLGAKKGLTQMETPFVARTNVTGSGKTTEAWYLYKGVYYKLSVYAVGLPLHFQGTPFFTDANGTRHNLKTYAYTWGVADLIINPSITDTIYKKTSTAYKLYYLDDNGNAVDIGNQVGNRSTTAYSGDLYKKNADESRLSALQKSVNTFIDTIAGQKNADGSRVDHRVAIVGFASGNQKSGRTNVGDTYYYEVNEYGSSDANIGLNTELFDGATQKNYFSGNLQDADYLAALKSTDQAGVQQLKASVNALEANGATFPNYGLEMAEHVFTSRGEEGAKYTKLDGVTKDNRNMVVVMFTDGVPGLNDYDNQFRAANNVVAEAKNLKDMDAEVYTVGVFSQDDTHPLQYSLKKYDTTTNSYSQTAAQQPNFLYSELETYTNGDYAFTYYMFRGNNTMEANGTDTVGNYMRVTSSNYEDATSFMDSNTPNPSTGLTGRGTATSDTHYMRASDTKALENVFKTIATSIHHTETPVGVDSHAVLKDVIDLEHFAPSDNYSVEAYTVLGTTTDDQEYHFGTTKMETLTPDPNTPDGTVAVSGFDYSEHHISSLSGQNGRQLVVKIKGLVPVTSADRLTSNSGTAKVEVNKDGKQVDVVTIGSPATKIGEKTYIIDFDAEMKVATGAKKLGKTTGTNGVFTPGSGSTFDVFYKLGGGLDGKNFTASYSGVDSAMVYGQPVGETGTVWNKITAVPANNIYFDDDLTQLTATENGSGFNGEVGMLEEETPAVGTYTFTFTGSRIDIYCTTDKDAQAVTAVLKEGDTVIKRKAISNKYQDAEIGALYNVPSVVFEAKDGVVAGHTYTVTLTAKQDSNYKLDGVRVYKAVAETGDVKTAYDNAQEANSTFLKVRDYLLTSSMISTLNQYLDDRAAYNALEDKDGVEPPVEPENIPGIAFYKDVAYEEGADQYAKLADYVKTGPKNEVYLANNEVVSFVIKNCPNNMQVWIGLSAPDGKTGSIKVNDEAYTPDIDSTVDMYYKVTPKEIEGEQTLKIENVGNSVISITNVKITGSNATNPSLNAKVLSVAEAEPAEDGAPYLAVTPKLLARMSAPAQAEDPQPTPTADPEPTPSADPEPTPTQPGFAEWISNLLSSFVSALFGSIARLFGN